MSLLIEVFFVTICLFAFLVGKKPDLDSEGDFTSIKGLPAICTCKLYPGYFVVLTCIIFAAVKYTHSFIFAAKWTGVVLATIATCVAIVFAASLAFKTSSYQALRAWLAAKKQKYCPAVEFD